jgi:hypothetical protein
MPKLASLEPDIAGEPTATGIAPPFVTVTDRIFVPGIVTVPNASEPVIFIPAPFPLNCAVCALPLPITRNSPVSVSRAEGVNVTVNVQLACASSEPAQSLSGINAKSAAFVPPIPALIPVIVDSE